MGDVELQPRSPQDERGVRGLQKVKLDLLNMVPGNGHGDGLRAVSERTQVVTIQGRDRQRRTQGDDGKCSRVSQLSVNEVLICPGINNGLDGESLALPREGDGEPGWLGVRWGVSNTAHPESPVG